MDEYPQFLVLENKLGAPESPVWKAFHVRRTVKPDTSTVQKRGVCIFCDKMVFGAPKSLSKHIKCCKHMPNNKKILLLDEQKRWWESNSTATLTEGTSEILCNNNINNFVGSYHGNHHGIYGSNHNDISRRIHSNDKSSTTTTTTTMVTFPPPYIIIIIK